MTNPAFPADDGNFKRGARRILRKGRDTQQQAGDSEANGTRTIDPIFGLWVYES